MSDLERHPLRPFLPDGATTLMLGTFPPPRARWCMEFYYPNFTNDMWRIFGMIFFNDKNRLVDISRRTFRIDEIKQLLTAKGIALYDTAQVVVREKGTAADKDLTIAEPTDIAALLKRLPRCRAIMATGKKACDVVATQYGIEAPPQTGTAAATGIADGARLPGTDVRLYRLPSTSRAFPMSIERKAEAYKRVFDINTH